MSALPPRPDPSPELRSSTYRWVRVAAFLISLLAGYELLSVFAGWAVAVLHVLLYIVFGLILAYLLSPFVDLLEKRAGMPRGAAVGSVLALLVTLLVCALYVISGPLISEARSLSAQLPSLLRRAQETYAALAPQLVASGISVSSSGLLTAAAGFLGAHLERLVISGVATTVQTVADVVIVLVVAFWLLKDGAQLRARAVAAAPARLREDLNFGFDAVDRVLGGYVRAQLLMAILIGALGGLGCLALGVPYPLLVGLAAGIFELIPIVGPFAGGAVGITLALTRSPVLALETLGLFLLIHFIEGYLLAPRVQGHFTRIHPLLAFLSVFAGIELGGFLGALFAVPVVSLASVFVRITLGDWRAQRPDLFRGPATDPGSRLRRRRLLEEFRFSPSRLLRRKRGLAE